MLDDVRHQSTLRSYDRGTGQILVMAICPPDGPETIVVEDAAPTRGEDSSAAAQLAREIRRLRKDAGLSHSRLAERIGYTRQYMSLAERVGRNLPSHNLVEALDTELHANGALLELWKLARAEQGAVRRARRVGKPASPNETATERSMFASRAGVVHDNIPDLRRVLDAHDLPDDGPVRSADELSSVVAAVMAKRLRSNYGDLAHELPELLSELHRAMLNCRHSERPAYARLLVQAYRAADAIADKHGYYDLSARIIDRLSSAAAATGDPVIGATCTYVRGETFFASKDLTTGRRVLERAAAELGRGDNQAAAATYGTLHMRASVMAGRAGQAATAWDHIEEAHAVAQRVDEGVHVGTAFGPASVRIHRLSLAVELCDVSTALRVASNWQPPASLLAERRSHFYVDLARAYHLAGHADETLEALHTAHRAAPEHISAHTQVKEIVNQLRITERGSAAALSTIEDVLAPA